MKNRRIQGQINIIERENHFEYGLMKKTMRSFHNHRVDKILEYYYYNNIKIELKLYILNEKIFQETGRLYKNKKFGNYEWFLKDKCFGDVLFENVDKKVRILIRKKS